MSKLKECPFCGGEVDWCKNDLDAHDPRGDCHYITCKTCGEFNLSFPDDLDWPEIYEYLADKWNNRTSTPNAKIQKLIDHYKSILPLCSDRVRMQMNIDDLKQLIKPEGE